MQEKAISLFELTSFIREAIESQQIRTWVVGEVSEVSFSAAGHVYLELVEKSKVNDRPIAKLRCNLWSKTAQQILPRFEQETGMQLAAGMKIMAFVTVLFHDVYGLAANILDIDSQFTLGDIELQKRETLMRLTADGVIDMNKQLALPTVIQRVAVISARTAAGFDDFCKQVRNNNFSFNIDLTLFPSAMQGADAEAALIDALDRIAARIDEFDIVVIIRGGGSRSDLACFDGYDLASNIAQFPLPVVTGIGHERDTSIADMVAHTRMKTPTAVAEFIIGHNREFDERLNALALRLSNMAQNLIDDETTHLQKLDATLRGIASQRLEREKHGLQDAGRMLRVLASQLFQNEEKRLRNNLVMLRNEGSAILSKKKTELDALGKQLDALNPTEVLKRGYTLTYVNDHKLTDLSQVKTGDKVVTIAKDGQLRSTVD